MSNRKSINVSGRHHSRTIQIVIRPARPTPVLPVLSKVVLSYGLHDRVRKVLPR